MEQFPEWADGQLRRIPDSGTDNAIYRLGEDMGIRLPRIDWAEAQIEKSGGGCLNWRRDSPSRYLSPSPRAIQVATIPSLGWSIHGQKESAWIEPSSTIGASWRRSSGSSSSPLRDGPQRADLLPTAGETRWISTTLECNGPCASSMTRSTWRKPKLCDRTPWRRKSPDRRGLFANRSDRTTRPACARTSLRRTEGLGATSRRCREPSPSGIRWMGWV
jgi:hypothetical protein